MMCLSMLHFPNGAVGESVIHEFLYELTNVEPFKQLREKLAFMDFDGVPFSQPLHKMIYDNCNVLSRMNSVLGPSNEEATLMFSDELRFDLYELVDKKESGYKKRMKDYVPRIFYLTNEGRSIAILSLQGKLTEEQIFVISSIANYYEENTYINTEDKNEKPSGSEEESDGTL